MKRFNSIFLTLQLICWIAMTVVQADSFFINQSPRWFELLGIALIVQAVAISIYTFNKKLKLNPLWRNLFLGSALIYGALFLSSTDIIHSRLLDSIQGGMMSILLTNLFYFLTVFPIVQELKKSLKQ